MGDKTSIEWTDATWQVTYGCSLESAGCRFCYAMRVAARLAAMGNPDYRNLTVEVNGANVWDGTVRPCSREQLLQPMRWRRPRVIFVNSMSDLFHPLVEQYHLDRVFAVMAMSPQHIYQVLTKRSERQRDYMRDPATPHRVMLAALKLRDEGRIPAPSRLVAPFTAALPVTEKELAGFKNTSEMPWPPRNVWNMVSVENQAAAHRIVDLLQTPSVMRGISAEPLIGPLDISEHLFGFPDGQSCAWCPRDEDCECGWRGRGELPIPSLGWVICGGESGWPAVDSRPMLPEWERDLRRQCVAAGVPYFRKQLGDWVAKPTAAVEAGTTATPAEDHPQMVRVGKRKAGNLIDGERHEQWPRGFQI